MVTLSCIYHAQTNLTPVDRRITIDVYVIKHIDEYNWVANRLWGNISLQMRESWPSALDDGLWNLSRDILCSRHLDCFDQKIDVCLSNSIIS